jgi:tRNA pseudouridine13 synthase
MTIKAKPEDFVVEEVVRAEILDEWTASGPAPFRIYRLEKAGIDTPRALDHASRGLGVRREALASAGLKDKHALTSQYISVRVPEGRELPAVFREAGMSLTAVGFSAGEISSAVIERNRFRITVRQLTREAAAELVRRAWKFETSDSERRSPEKPAGPIDLVIPNYFGAQRFGSARHGRGFAARFLLKGEFEKALGLLLACPMRGEEGRYRKFHQQLERHWGDWKRALAGLPAVPERRAIEVLALETGSDPLDQTLFREAFTRLPYFSQQICVEAYQSWLWNETARTVIEERLPPHSSIRFRDEIGVLVFPFRKAVREELSGAQLPLVAPSTVLAEPWQGPLTRLLASEGLTLSDLKIPGLRRPFFGEAPRSLFMSVSGARFGAVEDDEVYSKPARRFFKRVVTLELPRGAYATVVLRALGQ